MKECHHFSLYDIIYPLAKKKQEKAEKSQHFAVTRFPDWKKNPFFLDFRLEKAETDNYSTTKVEQNTTGISLMPKAGLEYYPKMERIASELRQEISDGRHGTSGSPFMTTRYLMTYKGISLKTAHKVLGVLCTEGLLEVKGKRYYLRDTAAASVPAAKKRIGLLLTRLDTPYFSNLASNLEEITRELGAELLISISGYDPDLERKRLKDFLKNGVSGIIACPWALADNEQSYRELPVPYVLIGRTLPGGNAESVLVDNLKAARQTAHHLIETGCREFFYVGPDNLQDDQRLNGFRIGLFEAGIELPAEHIIRLPDEHSSLVRLKEKLNHCRTRAGVFCYHDLFAAHVIHLCHESKISIPEKCAVTGFDNLPVASAIWPPLTSVAYPIRSIARSAVEILFTRMATGRTGGGTARYLEPELIVRQSSAGNV